MSSVDLLSKKADLTWRRNFQSRMNFTIWSIIADINCKLSDHCVIQSYEIKSPPWTIMWFRILGISSVENIARLGVFMFQTSDNSQLDSQYSSQ